MSVIPADNAVSPLPFRRSAPFARLGSTTAQWMSLSWHPVTYITSAGANCLLTASWDSCRPYAGAIASPNNGPAFRLISYGMLAPMSVIAPIFRTPRKQIWPYRARLAGADGLPSVRLWLKLRFFGLSAFRPDHRHGL